MRKVPFAPPVGSAVSDLAGSSLHPRCASSVPTTSSLSLSRSLDHTLCPSSLSARPPSAGEIRRPRGFLSLAAMSEGRSYDSCSTPSCAPLLGHGNSGFPLIDCLTCGVEKVVELTSKTKNNPGKIFFKCPRDQSGISTSCNFFMWIDKYQQYLVDMGLLYEDTTCLEDAIPELLEVTSDLKEGYDSMKGELDALKASGAGFKQDMDALKAFACNGDAKLSKLTKIAEMQMVVNAALDLFLFLAVCIVFAK